MHCNQCLGLWHLRHTRLDTHNDQYQCSSQHSLRTHKSLSLWHLCLRLQCLTLGDTMCIACFPHRLCRMLCHMHCNQYQHLWHLRHTRLDTHNVQQHYSSQHSLRKHTSRSLWLAFLDLQCWIHQDMRCIARFQQQTCRTWCHKACIQHLDS